MENSIYQLVLASVLMIAAFGPMTYRAIKEFVCNKNIKDFENEQNN